MKKAITRLLEKSLCDAFKLTLHICSVCRLSPCGFISSLRDFLQPQRGQLKYSTFYTLMNGYC